MKVKTLRCLTNRIRNRDKITRSQDYRARQIIATIGRKCKEQAKQGYYSATVMALERGKDYARPSDSSIDICKPEWLIGAAKLVYRHCVKKGLNPTLRHWIDNDEGFLLDVNW